jgi:hypothetical protein
MAEQDARGALTVARAEGELTGKRSALLRILTRRGIAPTGESLTRIEACADAAILDRWIENAIGAATLADVLT